MMVLDRIRGWITRWRQSTLLRRLGALTSGTVVAQAVQLLNLVVLARYFPLSEVGTYSIFLAVVGTLAPAIMLGYEMLIPAARDDELLPYLRGIAWLLVPITLTAGLGAFVGGYAHAASVVPWIAGSGLYRLGEMTNVRGNRFRLVATAKILPPLTMSLLLAITLLREDRNVNDLIVWQAALTFATGAAYAARSLPLRQLLTGFSMRPSIAALRRHSNAPLYLMPSNILNLIAYNVPVVVVGRWFGTDVAAQYAYVLRFGFGPVSLIGGTLYQVFYGLLAEAHRTGNQALFGQFLRARRHIRMVALAAILGTGLAYPIGFRLLGPQWSDAGWMSVIFAPFFGAMLYLTPLSVSLNTFGKQYYDLKTQMHYLLISIVSFGIAVLLNNIWLGLVLFSLLGCLRYGILLRDIDRILMENGVTLHATRQAA